MSARRRWWGAVAVGCIALFASVACNSPITQQGAEEQLYNNFKTVVATAPQDGYTAYWLGTGFEAGGLTFEGPFTAGFAQEVAGGGVSTDYDAPAGGGVVSLNITSYSPGAWEQSPVRRAQPPEGDQSVRAVQVAGHDALLRTFGDSQVQYLQLSFLAGTTTVVAQTSSLEPRTPGPDLNPLTDEATFLSVLQNLRPYPQ